jgi:hypothetical protein
METMTCHRTPDPGLYDKLADADLLLDQSLTAMNQGAQLEAMEAVYAVSCLLEEIRAALQSPRTGDDESSLVRPVRHLKSV